MAIWPWACYLTFFGFIVEKGDNNTYLTELLELEAFIKYVVQKWIYDKYWISGITFIILLLKDRGTIYLLFISSKEK